MTHIRYPKKFHIKEVITRDEIKIRHQFYVLEHGKQVVWGMPYEDKNVSQFGDWTMECNPYSTIESAIKAIEQIKMSRRVPVVTQRLYDEYGNKMPQDDYILVEDKTHKNKKLPDTHQDKNLAKVASAIISIIVLLMIGIAWYSLVSNKLF